VTHKLIEEYPAASRGECARFFGSKQRFQTKDRNRMTVYGRIYFLPTP
jgi:hypothetical protein